MFKLKQYSLKVCQINHHLQTIYHWLSKNRKILQQKSKDLFSLCQHLQTAQISYGLPIDSGPAQG